MSEHGKDPKQDSEDHANQVSPGVGVPPVAEVVTTRLAEADLPQPVKDVLAEALGDAPERQEGSVGRVYLDSLAVTGFRGIGPRASLNLSPRPGVNLVVGRNGCGKTSLAAGVEAAFSGTAAGGQGPDASRHGVARNLHTEADPRVEVGLAIDGEAGRPTLTRAWKGPDLSESVADLNRPGHGVVPLSQAPWSQALGDHRPFLSYADLDRLINGKPAHMYDNIAPILGLGGPTVARARLRAEEKTLDDALKAVKARIPGLIDALCALPDDERAIKALVAIDTKGSQDLDAVDALVAGLPDADEGRLAEARIEVDQFGPDRDEITKALDRLRLAFANVEDVRVTSAEDARKWADLLDRALEHSDWHPDEDVCPVCGTAGMLDPAWVASAQEQVARLRAEAKASEDARSELRSAATAVRAHVREPQRIAPVLREPWDAWLACRTEEDPAELLRRAYGAATTLVDACNTVRAVALAELEERDERWRLVVTELASWLHEARAAEGGRKRLGEVRKARLWLDKRLAELREQRMVQFADRTQDVWSKLRQKSNVQLTGVTLKGSEKAAVRKVVMDVTVDDHEASALDVMSQGEQHALALSLFLPRAVAADSPFGFVVIDDPVQSMDPAKVNGLAQVLHELGKDRQIVVFTHDTRLQRAFATQQLQVTVFEVERKDQSQVEFKQNDDPVKRAIDDAKALARTSNLPDAARRHVLPGLCRAVLERALIEAAWIRARRVGMSEDDLHAALSRTTKFYELAAVALLGNERCAREAKARLRSLHSSSAVELIHLCQKGAHPGGVSLTDPTRFVQQVADLAQKMRNPKVTA